MFGIEIIPNLHPMFVHFTVALLSLSVAFHVLDFVTKGAKAEWGILARWNLWLGAGFAIVTVLAGIYAYNTVAHDGPSHAAMTVHKNWALPTLLVFLALAGRSFMSARSGKTTSIPFLLALMVAGGLLLSTAWHGAELVYRHGLGVMSLPDVHGGTSVAGDRTSRATQSSGDGHGDTHEHGESGAGTTDMDMSDMSMGDTPPGATDTHDDHEH